MNVIPFTPPPRSERQDDHPPRPGGLGMRLPPAPVEVVQAVAVTRLAA